MNPARVAALALAGYVLVAGPFGEGGRVPGALAGLHLVVVGLAGMSLWRAIARDAGRPRGHATGVLVAAVAVPGLALVAATRAAYPYAASLGMMDRIAAAAAFTAGAALFAAPGDLLVLRNIAVLSTTAQAFVALVGAAEGGPETAARLFLNRNHLGAFLNLGVLLAAAAADEARQRRARRTAVLFAGAAAVAIAAVLLLQSRGALLGLLAGAVLFVARRWREWNGGARALAAGVALVVVALGAVLVAQRFARSDDPDRFRRISIWEAALSMAAPDPWLGIGPGQFAHEAPRHNFPLDRTPVRYGRGFSGAHSAWLTLAVEDGVPAALVAAAGIGALIFLMARRPGAGVTGAASLGVAASLVALATQGLVEDLQDRPVLVIGGALLAGAAIASARGWRTRPPAARLHAAGAAAVVLLVMWCGAMVLLPWAAWREAAAARAGGRAAIGRMRNAARLDPRNAGYHHDLAMAALNSGPPDVARYLEAARELDEARRLDPTEPTWALLRARLEARAARVVFNDPSADARAAGWYAESARLAPTDPRPAFEQAGHLADLGRGEAALAALDAALVIEPHYRRARLLQADLLRKAGRGAEARDAWERLLESDREVADYVPDSGYAAEIVADDPARRAALRPLLEPGSSPAGGPEVTDSK